MTGFVRQMGGQSAVQQNPLIDGSAVASKGTADQVIATYGRFARGRIDKPMLVTRSNFSRCLGSAEPVRLNPLNETHVLCNEALNRGAAALVVHRQVNIDTAKIAWIVCEPFGSGFSFRLSDFYPAITGPNPASVGSDSPLIEGEPIGPYLVAIKHLECFNSGIHVSIWAPQLLDEFGTELPTSNLVVTLSDENGIVLYEISGSLDPSATDAYGKSTYLPDVAKRQTGGLVELLVGASVDSMGEATDVWSIPTNYFCYGYDESGTKGQIETVLSSIPEIVDNDWGGMVYFKEGDTTYTPDDHDVWYEGLLNTHYQWGYVNNGCDESFMGVLRCARLSVSRLKPFVWGLPGDFSADEVCEFVNSISLNYLTDCHLFHAYWSPLISKCPSDINANGHFNFGLLQAAMRCARNAVADSYGNAAKNYPVAGYDFPVQRSGLSQDTVVSEADKDKLSKSGINPVLYEDYGDEMRAVFFDSLTQARTNSLRNLVAAAEMSADIDGRVLAFAKKALQKPMAVAIKQTGKYMKTLLESVERSGWLVPSDDPAMGGKSHAFTIEADPNAPYSKMNISKAIRYDGTVRQIENTQTITK